MNIKHKITIILLALLPIMAWADVFDDLTIPFQQGDATAIAKYFRANMDLTITTVASEDIYSSTQAEQLLHKFFSKNTPKSYTIIHRGTSKEGVKYSIATLSTIQGANYRVYMLIKTSIGKPFIQELRIEKES
jgi:hypothetical protein